MKIEVRYLSKNGNTKRIAEAIAKQAGVTAKPISDTLEGQVDLLFLGGAVYGFDLDAELKSFIHTLKPDTVKHAAVFGTSALVKSVCKKIRNELKQQGISVAVQEFHCPGEYLKLRRGRPNAEDIKNAEKFTQTVLQR